MHSLVVRAPDPVSTGGPRFNPWCVHTLYCGVTTEVPDRDQASHVQLLELQQIHQFISSDMKWRALYLLEVGWGPDDIVEVLGVSLKSIMRWERNHEEHG